jgi:hypothetical protein
MMALEGARRSCIVDTVHQAVDQAQLRTTHRQMNMNTHINQ